MENKYYRELGEKYGNDVYDMLLDQFVSVELFNDGIDGTPCYSKTIIAYPHLVTDRQSKNCGQVEMIDIINGSTYFLKKDILTKKTYYLEQCIYKINEDLFKAELEKDEIGRSEVTYDVTNFDKTIKQMRNFILTTHGTSKIEDFQPIEFYPEEIELQKKRQQLYENYAVFSRIKLANTCYVARMDGPLAGSKRKSKVKFNLAQTDVPVLVQGDKAINLFDGKTEYEILEYEAKNNKFFRRIELTDQSYDTLYNNLINDVQKEYIDCYGNIKCLGYDNVFNFSSDELRIITNNARKLIEKEKQKKLTK